jgi:eukaryotic-like serine/threonine-protein kinase
MDGMKLLYVPTGNFLMGSSDADPLAQPNEKPQHTVYLDAFWIDQTVVSNAMYAKCVQVGACTTSFYILKEGPTMFMDPYYGNHQYDNYPVLFVTWDQAVAYCKWAGRRLPTEAEWEKAARGTDGRIYPWGNQPPNDNLALYDQEGYGPMSVDSHPLGASPYGALNMAGNVWQWVSDVFYDKYYSCENPLSLYLDLCSPSANPQGPRNTNNDMRGVRGGSWHSIDLAGINKGFNDLSGASGVRSALRIYGGSDTDIFGYVGLRCALGTSQ